MYYFCCLCLFVEASLLAQSPQFALLEPFALTGRSLVSPAPSASNESQSPASTALKSLPVPTLMLTLFPYTSGLFSFIFPISSTCHSCSQPASKTDCINPATQITQDPTSLPFAIFHKIMHQTQAYDHFPYIKQYESPIPHQLNKIIWKSSDHFMTFSGCKAFRAAEITAYIPQVDSQKP